MDSLQMAFADLQRALAKFRVNDIGDRRRHAVADHIPTALKVAAKACALR